VVLSGFTGWTYRSSDIWAAEHESLLEEQPMKQPAVVTVALGAPAFALGLCLAWAVINLASETGLYLQTLRMTSAHINFRGVPQGFLDWRTTYITDDQVTDVWRSHSRHFSVEPQDGIGSDSPCIKLRGIQQVLVLQQVMTVMLCPVRHGTRVSVHQLLYLKL
jgi:hypothetical protein